MALVLPVAVLSVMVLPVVVPFPPPPGGDPVPWPPEGSGGTRTGPVGAPVPPPPWVPPPPPPPPPPDGCAAVGAWLRRPALGKDPAGFAPGPRCGPPVD